MEKTNAAMPVRGTKIPGIFGASFGSLLGCLPMCALTLLTHRFSGWLAVIVPFAAIAFYRLFHGYRSHRFAFLTVAICSAIYYAQAELLCRCALLAGDASWQQAAAENGMGAFELAWESLLSSGNFRVVFAPMLLGILFALAGTLMADSKIKEYAVISGEEEAGISALEKDAAERAEKNRAAKKLQEEAQKRAKPRRLEQYKDGRSAKTVLHMSFTARPARAQRQLLQIVSAATAALLVFVLVKLFKAQGADLLRKLSASAFAALGCFAAFRSFMSTRRYLEVDCGKLTCRPAFGQPHSFTLDDVDHCIKTENRVIMYSEDGSQLAFYSRTWENAKKLDQVLDAYGVPIEE